MRTPAEYEAGHIPTAVNVPVDVIGILLPAEAKDALIIVYCRSGNRSATARKILVDLGYTNVVDFGAVSRWEGSLVIGKEPGKASSVGPAAERGEQVGYLHETPDPERLAVGFPDQASMGSRACGQPLPEEPRRRVTVFALPYRSESIAL